MIKHSFVRSSKMPRVGFTTSHQPSPHKVYNTEQCQYRRRQSPEACGKIRSKQNGKNNQYLKCLLQQSLQQSKILPQYNTKQNEIHSLRCELLQLQTRMNSSKALEQRLSKIQQKVSQSNLPICYMNQTDQIKSIYLPSSDKTNYKVMHSRSETSQPQLLQCDTIALRQMSKGIHVLKQHSVTKQYLQQFITPKLQPLSKISQIQTSISLLSSDIKQLKKRQIHMIQLIQSYNQHNTKQLSSLRNSIKTQFQQYVKYQITKNNQVFFKLKNNDKNINDVINKKFEEEKQQIEIKNKELFNMVNGIKIQTDQKCNGIQKEIECLRQEVTNVIQNALQEFSNGLDELRSEQTELASISQSLMDIIKCLVKKTGQVKEQKPLDLIDILKSNIIDINTLKIQQNALSKQLQNLKPGESSSRKQKIKHLKQILQSNKMKQYTIIGSKNS